MSDQPLPEVIELDLEGCAVVDATWFRCDMCGGVFPTEWSDEDAQAECEQHFPGYEGETSVVCDDCF